jgi:tryptophanyl-tRNA synthetase
MTVRILSGVQPSGALHLGNYFGAIKQHIEAQNQPDAERFIFIADYHALTTVRDAAALRSNVRDVAITYLALGLDPARTTFYRQSDVPEVAELMWLLCTVTPMGLLERAHSYKEKVAKGLSADVGLFTYPVLMAADILAPQAHVVPVGQDQDQHVEMAKDMAEAFQRTYGKEVFTLPKAQMSQAPRVPGTTFEKGAVLQVNDTVRFTKSWWSAGEVEMYVRWLSDAAKQVLANNPAVDTTEALDTGLTAFTAKNPASAHGLTRDVEFEPVARMLRTVAEQPTSKVNLSRDGAVLTLEFYVPLERTLFVTKDGQRQAAKMSKSYGNTIPIFAEGKPLKKGVMGIETRLIDLADPMDPKEDLVLALYRLFASDAEVQDLEAKYRAGGFGFGRAKQLLLDKIDSHFAPARERKRQLEQDPGYVEGVLAEGANKARAVARRTLDAARAACGLA